MDEFLDNYITGLLILFLFTALIGFIVMLPKMFLFIAIASWPLGWIVRKLVS